MNAYDRYIKPVRHAMAVFFRHDLALRRADDGVRIVLQEPTERRRSIRPPSRAELSAAKQAQELALMRQQLTDLIDVLPETRLTLRHLVFVEHALAKKGLRALHKLPLDVLEHALEQLEGLVINWSPEGLAGLRSRMAVAILDREHMDPECDTEAEAYRSAAVLDTLPSAARAPQAESGSDADALAAAYAAVGTLAPQGVELQAELGSASARAVSRGASRAAARTLAAAAEAAAEIRLHELQS